MAQEVLLNPQIVINSVDLSNRIDSVTLELSYTDVEKTAFGDTAKRHIAGLGDHKFSMEYQQDYATAEVDATINPLVGTTTSVVMLKTKGTATSSVNPSWSFTVLVVDYKPIAGKVGDLVKGSVTWPIDGAVTRAIT